MTAQIDMAEAIAMIRQSAAGLADRRDLSRVRRLRYTLPGFDRDVWREICGLGWPALRLSEAHGGVGLSMAAYCALAQELGAALVPEPLIGAVLTAALLQGEALERHLSGQALILPAWQNERDACAPGEGLRFADGRLSGTLRYVALAQGADGFLVLGPGTAWLVAASAPGVSLSLDETQDGGHQGTLTLEGVAATPIAAATAGPFAEACLATSAYLLGMIDAAIERTADYLRVRVQFGKVIGSFQTLQHRMVDLKLEAELTRASVEDAAARWDQTPGSRGSLAAVSRAKVRAAATAALVTRQAIQLHGGIGYTDEHDISLFLRKAMVVIPQYGSAALHRERFAQLQPFQRD